MLILFFSSLHKDKNTINNLRQNTIKKYLCSEEGMEEEKAFTPKQIVLKSLLLFSPRTNCAHYSQNTQAFNKQK